jgi:hypothetical protein
MTSNRPSGRPSSGSSVPPTSRRSARQQRLAAGRRTGPSTRAGTSHGSGGGQILMYTIIAVVVAAVVIVGALLTITQPGRHQAGALAAPNPPVGSALTPTSIPVNGLTLGDANATAHPGYLRRLPVPHCRGLHGDTEPQIVANYVATGKAKIVFHDLLVIDSNVGGTESLDAANAARCAEDQGMFWPYHDWLLRQPVLREGSGASPRTASRPSARWSAYKDLTKFNSCVDSGTHNVEAARAALPPPQALPRPRPRPLPHPESRARHSGHLPERAVRRPRGRRTHFNERLI